jgi:hypothetical protein
VAGRAIKRPNDQTRNRPIDEVSSRALIAVRAKAAGSTEVTQNDFQFPMLAEVLLTCLRPSVCKGGVRPTAAMGPATLISLAGFPPAVTGFGDAPCTRDDSCPVRP